MLVYIESDIRYTIIEKNSNEALQSLWVEFHFPKRANVICGVVYRQHNSPEKFQKHFEETLEALSASGKAVYLMSDTNINLLHSSACNYAQNFLFSLQSLSLIPTIDKPTRVYNNKLDGEITSGNIISDISDLFTQFCITRRFLENKNPDKSYTRDYSLFSETRFLNELSDRAEQSRAEQSRAEHSTAEHSTAQHSTAKHSTAEQSRAEHSTAQQSTAQHSTAQHSTAQHSTAQHSTAQHSTAQHSRAEQSRAEHSTAQHSTVQQSRAEHSTAQHSTAQYSSAEQSRAEQSRAEQSRAEQSRAK